MKTTLNAVSRGGKDSRRSLYYGLTSEMPRTETDCRRTPPHPNAQNIDFRQYRVNGVNANPHMNREDSNFQLNSVYV